MTASGARQLADAWDARVVADRAQVERIRAGAEADDFYAPVSARFVDDPRRSGDDVLAALVALAVSSEAWLDIGAGAGRYALPLALAVREVVAVEPSPAMVAALREGMARHGIENVRIVESRWPPEPVAPSADVALIAHVGYDVEPIAPFLDAMEGAAARLCVAVLMDRAPATYAARFWPVLHGEERVALPALGDFVELLRARGSDPRVRRVARPPRVWPDSETLLGMLRHQLWIPAGGPDDERLRGLVDAVAQHSPDGVRLPDEGGWIGVVDWTPHG